MNEKVTLQELVIRLSTNLRLLETHPEQKEMLEKRIEQTKDEIIKTLLNNSCNPYLSYINKSGEFPG